MVTVTVTSQQAFHFPAKGCFKYIKFSKPILQHQKSRAGFNKTNPLGKQVYTNGFTFALDGESISLIPLLHNLSFNKHTVTVTSC